MPVVCPPLGAPVSDAFPGRLVMTVMTVMISIYKCSSQCLVFIQSVFRSTGMLSALMPRERQISPITRVT